MAHSINGEFENIASTLGFTHITISLHYPKSNGPAEQGRPSQHADDAECVGPHFAQGASSYAQMWRNYALHSSEALAVTVHERVLPTAPLLTVHERVIKKTLKCPFQHLH